MDEDFKEFVEDAIGGVLDEIRDSGAFMENSEAADLIGEALREVEEEIERREKGDTLVGKPEKRQRKIKVELLAKVRSDELVLAHDGDVAWDEVERAWNEKIDSEGDELVKLDICGRIEQLERGVFSVPVEVVVRRTVTVEDGLLSLKFAQILKEIDEMESNYQGLHDGASNVISCIINRHWRQ